MEDRQAKPLPAAQDVPVMSPRRRVLLIATMKCRCTLRCRQPIALVMKSYPSARSSSLVYPSQSKVTWFLTLAILCVSVASSHLFICRHANIVRLSFKLRSIFVCQRRSSSLSPPRSTSQCHFLVVFFFLAFSYVEPSRGGMQSSRFLCLSQARINCKGCSRKGIWHKNGGC